MWWQYEMTIHEQQTIRQRQRLRAGRIQSSWADVGVTDGEIVVRFNDPGADVGCNDPWADVEFNDGRKLGSFFCFLFRWGSQPHSRKRISFDPRLTSIERSSTVITAQRQQFLTSRTHVVRPRSHLSHPIPISLRMATMPATCPNCLPPRTPRCFSQELGLNVLYIYST